jgi:ribosomal protein L40E
MRWPGIEKPIPQEMEKPMSSQTCRRCSQALPSQAVYCRRCGLSVKPDAKVAAKDVPIRKSSSGNGVGGFFGWLVIVALMGWSHGLFRPTPPPAPKFDFSKLSSVLHGPPVKTLMTDPQSLSSIVLKPLPPKAP